MSKKVDLTGLRFGRLLVLKEVEAQKGRTTWECLCDCGKTACVPTKRLSSGQTQSCGCLHKLRVTQNNLTHGMTAGKIGENRIPRVYRTWANMKSRCSNPKDNAYSRYGGRGIRVCDEWRDNFKAFHDWAVANGYQDDLQIDRIDNDGNYEPDNCRWVTMIQNANNKRGNLLIEFQGEVHTAAEWSRITGISLKSIYTRHQAGKPPEEILKP